MWQSGSDRWDGPEIAADTPADQPDEGITRDGLVQEWTSHKATGTPKGVQGVCVKRNLQTCVVMLLMVAREGNWKLGRSTEANKKELWGKFKRMARKLIEVHQS